MAMADSYTYRCLEKFLEHKSCIFPLPDIEGCSAQIRQGNSEQPFQLVAAFLNCQENKLLSGSCILKTSMGTCI